METEVDLKDALVKASEKEFDPDTGWEIRVSESPSTPSTTVAGSSSFLSLQTPSVYSEAEPTTPVQHAMQFVPCSTTPHLLSPPAYNTENMAPLPRLSETSQMRESLSGSVEAMGSELEETCERLKEAIQSTTEAAELKRQCLSAEAKGIDMTTVVWQGVDLAVRTGRFSVLGILLQVVGELFDDENQLEETHFPPQKAKRGTVFVCQRPCTIWSSSDSWERVGHLVEKEIVVAADTIEDSGDFQMLPIIPKGAVEAGALRLQSWAMAEENISQALHEGDVEHLQRACAIAEFVEVPPVTLMRGQLGLQCLWADALLSTVVGDDDEEKSRRFAAARAVKGNLIDPVIKVIDTLTHSMVISTEGAEDQDGGGGKLPPRAESSGQVVDRSETWKGNWLCGILMNFGPPILIVAAIPFIIALVAAEK